jgi:hypothetical protein
MRFPNRPDMWHHPWWASFEWIIPMLMLALLVGLVVWTILRLSDRNRPVASSLPTPGGIDQAIVRARLRYAGGEIDRETFVQISHDLSPPGETAAGPETDPAAPAG